MRIAFVVQRYGQGVVGGAESYVHSMATGLAAEGHQVKVLTSCATSYEDWADVHPAGCSDEEGVQIERLPVRVPRDNERFIPLHLRAVDTAELPLWPWAQRRWAQMMGPDMRGAEAAVARCARDHDVTVLVGYHYAQTLCLTRAAAAHGPTVVIPTAHPEGAFHVGVVREMFEHADRVVCLAPEEADLIDLNHSCRDRIEVVPCPVEPVAPPPEQAIADAMRRYDVVRGRYGIVVGRVDPAKGSDDAIRFAGAYARSVDPGFRLLVVGPGDTAAASGVDAVRCTGFVDEATKLALLAGAGFLLQPSYMESFSLALIEGWMLERPALVQARSKVLAGHVARSGGGLSYERYADFEAAAALVLGRPDLSAAVGRQGHRYALREFAWDKVAREFVAAMEQARRTGDARLGATTPEETR